MPTDAATLDAARELADRIATDPEWLIRDVLGDDLWEVPQAIVRAVARPRARVAVKACHSSGKTFTAARIVIWWVLNGGIAITTAPTDVQVRRLLWGEIHKAHAAARYPLGGQMLTKEWRVGPDCFAFGLATNEGVRFQGWHGSILLVLDEAPGVRAEIYEAIEGIRAGGDVRLLLIGNPTEASGPFFDAFGARRAGWDTFTIDAFATPNLRRFFPPGVDPALLDDEEAMAPLLAASDDELDANPRPYLTTPRWVLEMWDEWGPDSPLWQARVRGRFPLQSISSLISLAWIEAAEHRELEPLPDDPWEAGVDVAGPGEDETVLTVRHGPTVELQQSWTHADPRGDVLAALNPYAARLKAVKVDTVGVGHYFARHLEDHGYHGRVRNVNVGEATTKPEKFANLRAELYWGLRERFRTGQVAGLRSRKAAAQLATLHYEHTPKGQVAIEPKEDAVKRGVKSPDWAESLMLAFAPGKRVSVAWI